MNILLVCTGNTCRSPMAAGFLTSLLGGCHKVGSAGIHAVPGMGASEHAMTVMSGNDIDISSHKSRQLTEDMIKEADLILTMTASHMEAILRRYPSAEGKVHTLGGYSGVEGDISDPFGGSLGDYMVSAGDILAHIREIATKIVPCE